MIFKTTDLEFLCTFGPKEMLTYKKNNTFVRCTHTKSSPDLVKYFEKDHKPLNGCFEYKRRYVMMKTFQQFERVIRARLTFEVMHTLLKIIWNNTT